MSEINTVICGDSAEVLRQYPDNFFDSVVCDPPYGLSKEPDITEVLTKWMAGEPYDHGHGGFMGKAWDSFVPHPDLWREVFRVLKPGGHALVFAGTRTQDLMTIALRLGGFEIRDVIEWLYFSGFPKSMDVGKAFDRRRTEDLPGILAVTAFIAKGRDSAGKTNRDIDDHFGLNGMAGHWTTQGSQPQVPKLDQWYALKTLLSLTDEMDELVYELNGRKGTLGEAWADREKVGEKTSGIGQAFGDGVWVSESKVVDITAPATELARKWDGWGTAFKPAHEPVIVARKPLAGTVAETVEKYGTGAINIDGCRIGDAEIRSSGEVSRAWRGAEGRSDRQPPNPTVNTGRFPANCVTTDADAFYSPYFNVSPAEISKKATKRDRNQRVDGMPSPVPNTHPTVKPVDLMRWLITLVTPQGGTVLDPFAGSGTTLVAASQNGFNYVGIEMLPEHVAIINARLDANNEDETEAA